MVQLLCRPGLAAIAGTHKSYPVGESDHAVRLQAMPTGAARPNVLGKVSQRPELKLSVTVPGNQHTAINPALQHGLGLPGQAGTTSLTATSDAVGAAASFERCVM